MPASRGRLAQLGEHQLDKLGVTGSSPVPPIIQKPCKSGAFVFLAKLERGSGSATWKDRGKVAAQSDFYYYRMPPAKTSWSTPWGVVNHTLDVDLFDKVDPPVKYTDD